MGIGLWGSDSEVFPIDGNQIMGVGLMSEVTRGQVDNENDSQSSQSRYSNISNIVQGGGLYESEGIAIRNRKISEYRLEHRNAISEHRTGTGTGTGTKL